MRARACLLVLFLFPFVGWAQTEKYALGNQVVPTASIIVEKTPTDFSDDYSTDRGGLVHFTANDVTEASGAQTDTVSKSAVPDRSDKSKKIDFEGSMVGYIDDAIVQSQVRVRFDAGLRNTRPDRAEYFYAGSNTAPDPSSPPQHYINFQQLYFDGEYAPIRRFSFFTQVPVRWIQPTFFGGVKGDLPSGSGISDVQAGIKFAAIAGESRHLTFQLRAAFPSGDGARGLGTGHQSIEPMVLYYQRLSSRTSVEAELGDTHPIGGTRLLAPPHTGFAGDVLIYGIGPSYQVVQRPSYGVAPVLELVSWHVFGGLQTSSHNTFDSADGINVVNVKAGVRANFRGGNSIYLGYGRALTSDIWYRDLFRTEYRHTF